MERTPYHAQYFAHELTKRRLGMFSQKGTLPQPELVDMNEVVGECSYFCGATQAASPFHSERT